MTSLDYGTFEPTIEKVNEEIDEENDATMCSIHINRSPAVNRLEEFYFNETICEFEGCQLTALHHCANLNPY